MEVEILEEIHKLSKNIGSNVEELQKRLKLINVFSSPWKDKIITTINRP